MKSLSGVMAELSVLRQRYGARSRLVRSFPLDHLPFPSWRLFLPGLIRTLHPDDGREEGSTCAPYSGQSLEYVSGCLAQDGILEANTAALEFLEIDSAEHLPENLSGILTPRFAEGLGRLLAEILSGKKSGAMETELRVLSGDIRNVVLHWRTEGHDVVDLPPELLISFVDLAILREDSGSFQKEHAIRTAMENSLLAGVVIFEMDGRHSYANDAFCTMVGWSREELMGNVPSYPYWPPDLHEEINRTFAMHVSGKEQLSEVQFVRKNGEQFPCLVLGSPLRNAAGKVTGWLASVYDISDQKRVEDRMKRSEQKYRLLFDSMPVGIGIATLDGKLLNSNPKLRSILGYGEDEVKDIDFCAAYVNKADGDFLLDALRQSGAVKDFETRLRSRNDTIYHTLLNMERVPLLGPDMVLITVRDTTSLKQKEEALRLKQTGLSALLELGRLKSPTPQRMVQFVLERCLEISESGAGTLVLWGEDSTSVVSEASGAAYIIQALNDGIPTQSAGHRQRGDGAERFPARLVLMNNIQDAARPIKRLLSVPLYNSGQVRCVLTVANKEAAYTEADVEHMLLLLDGLWHHLRERKSP